MDDALAALKVELERCGAENDAATSEYAAWWPSVRRALRTGGLVLVDNATSHRAEMAPFVAVVAADAAFTSCLVPVGKGEFLAVKRPA